MANATFALKNPKLTGPDETPIYLFFTFDRQRLKYGTGVTVRPSQWLPKKHRAQQHLAHKNQTLQRHETAVTDAYYRLLNQGAHITPELLKQELKFEPELEERPQDDKPTTLIGFAERHVKAVAGQRAKSTLQVYTSTIQHLKDFEKENRRRISYTFEAIDAEFYNKFTDYLTNEKKHSVNTVGKVVKTVKAFMTAAGPGEGDCHTNAAYKSKSFKVSKVEIEAIYLTTAELEVIDGLELAGSLANVRDIFLIGATTGLRFSDLAKLSTAQIEHTPDGKVWRVRTQKTDDSLVIPFHPMLERILARNGGEPPKAYSNAHTNAQLKIIGKLAGLTQPVTKTRATGTLKASTVYQKWELLY